MAQVVLRSYAHTIWSLLRSALKCCKRALNVDSSHYLALVFSGLCQAEAGQYAQAAEVRSSHCKVAPIESSVTKSR